MELRLLLKARRTLSAGVGFRSLSCRVIDLPGAFSEKNEIQASFRQQKQSLRKSLNRITRVPEGMAGT